MFKVQERRAGAKAIWCKNKQDAWVVVVRLILKGMKYTCTDREGREVDFGNLPSPKIDMKPKA
jgi:hypothetical protein